MDLDYLNVTSPASFFFFFLANEECAARGGPARRRVMNVEMLSDASLALLLMLWLGMKK